MAPNIKIILYGSKYSDLYYSNKKSPARVIFFRFDTHFPKLLLCYVNRLLAGVTGIVISVSSTPSLDQNILNVYVVGGVFQTSLSFHNSICNQFKKKIIEKKIRSRLLEYVTKA